MHEGLDFGVSVPLKGGPGAIGSLLKGIGLSFFNLAEQAWLFGFVNGFQYSWGHLHITSAVQLRDRYLLAALHHLLEHEISTCLAALPL